VFSWIEHGIHLFPPAEHNGWKYGLRVTNLAYAGTFVRMAEALIEHEVPFTAHDLTKILDYLSGESWFSVNGGYDLATSFNYAPSREHRQKYFKHVEWEPLEMPKVRNPRLKPRASISKKSDGDVI
jgi:hypothetical protein